MSKIAVLVSGGGTNFKQILKNNIEVDCVIADRECGAKKIAEKNDIEFILLDRKILSQNQISEKILTIAQERKINLIVLAGFLSILNGDILKVFKKKIINIHPSLLPKYGGKGMHGLKVHQAVWKNKEKISGCTVHYVTEQIDAGDIIGQTEVDISSATNPEEIQKLVLVEEWKLLPKIIKEKV